MYMEKCVRKAELVYAKQFFAKDYKTFWKEFVRPFRITQGIDDEEKHLYWIHLEDDDGIDGYGSYQKINEGDWVVHYPKIKTAVAYDKKSFEEMFRRPPIKKAGV